MNGKKTGKEKPKIIETGDSFPIIDDEKNISDPSDVKKHGYKIAANGGCIGRWPKCPHCGKYIEKLKIRGNDVDLLDRDVVSANGKINYDIIKEHGKEEIPKAIPVNQANQIPKGRVFSMKNTKYLLTGLCLFVIVFFAYKYFFNREGHRLNFPVVITNFQEAGGYFTIQGTIENNMAPIEARSTAKFYDGFGKVIFVKRFPKQFFNIGISPMFLSVKNHKGVQEVEVFIEK